MSNTSAVHSECLDAVVEGAVNLRDLGGFRTHDGLAVRPGRVYRSGMMQHITPAGLAALRDTFGIRTVVDLRNAQELEADGVSPFEDHGIAWRSVPIGGDCSNVIREQPVHAV